MAALGILGVAAVYCALYGAPTGRETLTLFNTTLAENASMPPDRGGFTPEVLAAARPLLWTMAAFCLAAGAFWFFVAGIAWLRRRAVLKLIRIAFALSYVAFFAWQVIVFHRIAQGHDLTLAAGGVVDLVESAGKWWAATWPLGLLVLFIALLDITSRTRVIIIEYTGEAPLGQAAGDRIIEDLRTFGRDPKYRKSVFSSTFLHVFLIVLLPIFLDMFGCVENYKIPKGSGDPVVQLVVQVKPKQKPKQRFILNPNTDIIMHIPDLDDSEVLKEVNEESQDQYVATPAHSGKPGQGGGKEGGWPEGAEDAIFRFIRLEYRGEEWDDGMDGSQRADQNFLKFFKEATGFKAAQAGESHPISYLSKYDEGYAPPFVYMTGEGRYIGVSGNDIRTLREYLTGGGMLIADAGSREWHPAFEAFIKQVLPGSSLVSIADDDPIFQRPFTFPNGAPPLWHHAGIGSPAAKGMKIKGRWAVFYHTGDLNDAWKAPAYVDLPPEKIAGAKELGVNLVYYAFTNYLKETAKYRK